MEIVINLPDRIYYGVKNGITVNGSDASQILIDAVKSGKPLEDMLVEFANWYDIPFGHDKFMSLPECGVNEFLKQRGEKIG